MKLVELLDGIGTPPLRGEALPGLEIRQIADDSREVGPGTLFVALQGEKQDGHRFINEAIDRGALVIVAQESPSESQSARVGWVRVGDSRKALVELAVRFFGDPSRGLRLIGVTGTNGKTTTAFLGRAVLESGSGKKAGILGTIFYDDGAGSQPAPNTTPGVLSLQRFFRQMRDRGIDQTIMEVSSHALDQERVAGCIYTTAVFTNLTQDHLDYHHSMERYFSAKCKLFDRFLQGTAVINVDDPYGRRLAGMLKEIYGVQVLTYALEEKADLVPNALSIDRSVTRMRVSTRLGALELTSPLIGRYNAYNLLAGIGIGLSEGMPLERIAQGIERLRQVPGRFERIEGNGYQVVVDYAHTEDALNRLLEAARMLKPMRLLTLFGCGGNRDRGKRSRMGRVAAHWSDFVMISSDNPREEDPLEIIREVEEGIRLLSKETGQAHAYEAIVDRRRAIERLLSVARAGDLVVIAGKGHEREQIIGGKSIPFDDREVVREILKKGTAVEGQGATKPHEP